MKQVEIFTDGACSGNPGKGGWGAVLRYGDPESGGYLGAPMECLWETPWLDLGKAYMKRDFVLRFTADADENDVPIEMTIKTERREKTRVVLLQRQRK